MTSRDWNRGETSGLVSIGTHSLHLSTSGHSRQPGEPIVVLMQGQGSSPDDWAPVVRLVSRSYRWLSYHLSGMGQSEDPPTPPQVTSAVSVAQELDALLRAAGVDGPYVVVAHSWGGITSREFLELRPNDVAGMVFVDANTEEHFYYRQDPMPVGRVYAAPWQDAIDEGMDWVVDSGLAADTILTADEWAVSEAYRHDERNSAAVRAQSRSWVDDGPRLARLKQLERKPLGKGPVSILRGDTKMEHQRMYDAGVKRGKGTEEDRKAYRDFIASWDEKDSAVQREMLKLSSVGRMKTVQGAGHNLEIVFPEVVAEEIEWVMREISGGKGV